MRNQDGPEVNQVLVEPLDALTRTINSLVGGIDELKRQLRRSKWVTRALAVSLFIDLALTLALCFVTVRVEGNSTRIGDVQQRVSSRVLCPLYLQVEASVLGPRSPGETNKQWDQQVADRTIFKDALNVLGC